MQPCAEPYSCSAVLQQDSPINWLCLQGALKPPAGICAVPVAGITNVDVSELVDGHLAYTSKMDAVLDHLELS